MPLFLPLFSDHIHFPDSLPDKCFPQYYFPRFDDMLDNERASETSHQEDHIASTDASDSNGCMGAQNDNGEEVPIVLRIDIPSVDRYSSEAAIQARNLALREILDAAAQEHEVKFAEAMTLPSRYDMAHRGTVAMSPSLPSREPTSSMERKFNPPRRNQSD